MNAPLRLASLLAAVAVVTLGIATIGGRPAAGPPTTGPTSPSSAQPSASINPSPSARPAGLREVTSNLSPHFALDVPGGWEEWMGAGWYSLKKSAATGPFPVEIVFANYRTNAFDSLGCDGPSETAIAPSIRALMDALVADPRVSITSQGAVSLANHSGEFVDVQLSPSWTGTCPDSSGQPAAAVHSLVYLRPGDRQRLILVDNKGAILVVRISGADADSLGVAVAEAMPIVASLRFTP